MVKEKVHKQNKKLKEQLWKKGYYVQEVGQEGEPDYLIVSTAPPKQKSERVVDETGFVIGSSIR